jgi:hypothetical protein
MGGPKRRLVFAKAQASIQKLFLKTKNLLNVLWFTVVRFEKLRVFLLKSSWTKLQLRWASSAAVELFSWTKLQLSWASSAAVEPFKLSWTSAELNFFNCSWAFSTTVELSQLQLNFNFNCEPLWPYTSWTCLWAVELGFSLLNSLVKTSWTGFLGAVQLVSDPSDLWPLTNSLPVRLANRSTESSVAV